VSIWYRWSLKGDPYGLNPIDETSLDSFVGRQEEVIILRPELIRNQSPIFIESDSGMGSTSIGNYVRFNLLKNQSYFTPPSEITISYKHSPESILLNLLSLLALSLEIKHPFVSRDQEYLKVKLALDDCSLKDTENFLTLRESENRYIKSNLTFDDAQMYLDSLREITERLGYENGIFIQMKFDELINEDTGLAIIARFLCFLSDSFFTRGFKWLLIGDRGIHKAIATVCPDSLKISYASKVSPLKNEEVVEILERRKEKLSLSVKTKLPLRNDAVEYVYSNCQGKIKYAFEICSKLSLMMANDLMITEMDRSTAQRLISQLGANEIWNKDIGGLSLKILKTLVSENEASPVSIAKKLGTSQPNVSRALGRLMIKKLVNVKDSGNRRIYSPSLYVKGALENGI